MPGAPMHPHRGFCECPYAKEMTAEEGVKEEINCFQTTDHLEDEVVDMRTGDFEFGFVGMTIIGQSMKSFLFLTSLPLPGSGCEHQAY